jgi:DivIVA domain-containing protein
MSIDPDVVTRKTFENSFRGYDPMEVQAFLLVVADELRAARDREFDLELRLSEADRRARESYAEVERLRKPAPPPPPAPTLEDLDPAELARLLGDETARVLEAARTSAGEISARAEAEAEALLAQADEQARARVEQATEEADQVRTDAADEAAARRREAEADISELRVVALDEIETARERALHDRAEAQSALEAELLAQRAIATERVAGEVAAAEESAAALRAEAEALHAEAIEAARAVAIEARDFRKHVLTDLAARRHTALEQLEHLQAARDHLVEALTTARSSLDELADGAETMLDDAREAAEAARAAVVDGGPATVDELEAFLASRSDATATLAEVVGAAEGSAESPDATRARPTDDAEPEVVTSLFARIRADADAFLDPVPADDVLPPTEEQLTQLVAAAEAHNESQVAADAEATDPVERAEPVQADASEDVAAQRAVALAGPERGLGRVLKRLLSEEQNELLDAVRRTDGLPGLDDVLGDTEGHAVRYAGAARAELRDAAYAGAHLLGTPAAGTERPDVDDLAAELGVAVIVPLREQLAACWVAEDTDVVAVAREIYRDWRTKVLPEITQKHVARAFNRGLEAAAGSDAEPWLVPVA